jgi:hypothetical protein
MCVAQQTSPSPSRILRISCGSIGPIPDIWIPSYPIFLTFAQLDAMSAGVLQKFRNVYIWAAINAILSSPFHQMTHFDATTAQSNTIQYIPSR